MRLLTCLLALLWGGAAAAQEVVDLGDGRAFVSNGVGIETDTATGARTLVLDLAAQFDPEPYGEVPSYHYGRLHRNLCQNVVLGNAEAVRATGATAFRVVHRWVPEGAAPGRSRFHQSNFDLDEDLTCLHRPSVGADFPHIATLPGGRIVALRFAEPGEAPDELRLTFETTSEGDARFSLANQNIAFEACAVLAPMILAHRAEGWPHLRTDYVRIAFEASRPGSPPASATESYLFAVDGTRCVSGLSAEIEAELRAQFEG